MRIAIAGAGKVGRAIARELVSNGHDVLLIDREPEKARADVVPGATALLGDTCEIAVLDQADLPGPHRRDRRRQGQPRRVAAGQD